MPRAKYQIERKCKICGKPFMALTIESQYCSPACGQKAYKIRKREQKRNEELQQVIEGLDSDRDFITVPEAIALFAVGRQTLYHYIRSGKIPSVNLGQRLTRLSKKQLGELFPLRTSVIDGEVKTVRKLYDMEPENCYTITEICSKKKAYSHTKVAVKLRKSPYAEAWFIYLEAYPVYDYEGAKPKRVREYLNRTITTPVWDKNQPTRGKSNGEQHYMPKRDVNGVIQCRSQVDQQSCMYADRVRDTWQHEYDSTALYTEKDAETAAQQEKSRAHFLDYVKFLTYERHKGDSESIIGNWERFLGMLKEFTGKENIPFSEIDMPFIENYRNYVLTAPKLSGGKGIISKNTASTYFSILKAALKQAFIDGYLTIDISAKVKGIKGEESRREFLTEEELNRLANTPCDKPILKKAALFSALTGLRHSDIQKLRWSEIQEMDGKYRLNFTQKKTKGVEYMPIPEFAYKLCGERQDPELLVFPGLPDPSWISRPLRRWIESAGITRNITFHCLRRCELSLLLITNNLQRFVS